MFEGDVEIIKKHLHTWQILRKEEDLIKKTIYEILDLIDKNDVKLFKSNNEDKVSNNEDKVRQLLFCRKNRSRNPSPAQRIPKICSGKPLARG